MVTAEPAKPAKVDDVAFQPELPIPRNDERLSASKVIVSVGLTVWVTYWVLVEVVVRSGPGAKV